MARLADLFKTCYLTSGNGIEFADIRLHYRGVDEICRAFGASALTIGSDISSAGAFAPHTPGGLRLLAHEVAHVVQQRRGPVTAPPEPSGRAGRPLSGGRSISGPAGASWPGPGA